MVMELCEVCKKSMDECICCAECGHICSLDRGETYCPVCLPERKLDDEYFMRLALEEAKKAFDNGEVPVGAVLVMDNVVMARATNSKEMENDPTAHAELIAIRKGASQMRNWRLTSATLYVTKEPCIMCAGAMVHARLGRLVYGCEDTKGGAVHSLYQILSDMRLNHRVKIISGILRDECATLLRKFFQDRR